MIIDESDASIYMLGKLFTKKSKRKSKGGKYEFELYKINKNSNVSLAFNSDEKYIDKLKIKLNEEKLFAIGFYSNLNDNRYKGIAYFDFDLSSMSLKNKIYSPFTEQFLVDKYGKKKQKELKNIVIGGIDTDKKGNCYLNAEEYYMKSSNNPSNISSFSSYHYRDIICAKINSSGKLEWARNINKNQSAGGKVFGLSYKNFYSNNKGYFFLNSSDELKKIGNNRIEFKGGLKKPSLYLMTVDENGNFEFKKLLTNKEIDLDLLIQFGEVSKNRKSVILPGVRKNKKQLIKVSI